MEISGAMHSSLLAFMISPITLLQYKSIEKLGFYALKSIKVNESTEAFKTSVE